MSVTITDVAKHAGVSIETVSRVINDGPFVVEATHAKVVAAMQELGYVPKASARCLVSGRPPVLGLVFHNATWNHIN
jgi:LacI family transcriptional regulator